MQHPDEGTIHSWLDGALSAEEVSRLEAHVKDCPQCAAAMAEARGFIAASSPILTALDNAPRGVIPVAAPKKRVDPIVWRVAATLLVVAGGTFVVFRNGGREAKIATTSVADTVPNATKALSSPAPNEIEPAKTSPRSAPTMSLPRNSGREVAGGNAHEDVFSGKGATKMGAADMSTATPNAPAAVAPPDAYSAQSAAPPSQANVLDGKATDRGGNMAKASVPTPQLLSPAAAGSVVALDAASEAGPLKVVGKPRQIGARITLYEVAPGDTVTLTEIESMQLQGVVVTGVSTARTASQPTEKSAAAPTAKRAVAPAVSASDSQGATGMASPASAQATQTQTGNALGSRTGSVQVSNGVATITWADPGTGNAMKLSGRISPARLQQVKAQIERERAAAAAKKKP